MRPIDADELYRNLTHLPGDYVASFAGQACLAQIEDAPTLDYEPVRHGEWKETGCNTFCQSCGEKPLYDYFGKIKLSHHCPNCGAKMDGGKRNAKVD